MLKLCLVFITVLGAFGDEDSEALLNDLIGSYSFKPKNYNKNVSSVKRKQDLLDTFKSTEWRDAETESPCICVKFYQCNDNGTLNTHGENLIDIRQSNSGCPHYLDECCKPSEISQNEPEFKPLGGIKDCGYHNPDGVGFKIKGNLKNESQFGEFPWMVAVIDGSNKYVGGGALIHPQVVITATHRVIDQTGVLKIRAGEWDTQTVNEIFGHQDRKVRSVISHPKYDATWFYNDITLLILDKPFKLGPHVNTICLPPKGTNFDKKLCLASGWGKDVFGKEGIYQVILKKLSLPTVGRTSCENTMRKPLGSDFQLDRSFICAGGKAGEDTCEGDGGSPLVCPIAGQPGRFLQAGIVSWGIECGLKDIPGVYVNVAEFRDWIDEKMAINNFNTQSYKFL